MRNFLVIIFLFALSISYSQEFGNNDFRISDMGTDGSTSFIALKPRVAYCKLADLYLVVWAADDNRGGIVDNEFEIYGQFIDGTGNEIGSNDFRISFLGVDGDTAFRAEDPDVAFNYVDNEFFVVWKGETSVDGENEIFGQRINAITGSLIGSNFRISDMGIEGDTSTGAFFPKVEYNSANNEYLVVWEGDDNINNKFEIYGQVISNQGIEIGNNDFKISSQLPADNANFDAQYPNLSYNNTHNDFLVVWHGETLVDNETEVFGQILDADTGTLTGSNFRISDMGPDNDTNFSVGQSFGVAYNEIEDEYLVVWYGSDLVSNTFEVYGQRISSNGGELGVNDFRISFLTDVSSSYDAWASDLVWNKSNNEYLVVYRGDSNTLNEEEIYGQKISGVGDLVDNSFLLSDMGPDGDPNYDADYPSISTNNQNGYIITWQGVDNIVPNDGETEIYIQMYGDSTLDVYNYDTFGFSIFPNPTSRYIHFNLGRIEVASVQLYNSVGQSVNCYNFSGNKIDLADLNEGVYLLKIFGVNNEVIVRKIIKMYK